jgi:hypothetical protein
MSAKYYMPCVYSKVQHKLDLVYLKLTSLLEEKYPKYDLGKRNGTICPVVKN